MYLMSIKSYTIFRFGVSVTSTSDSVVIQHEIPLKFGFQWFCFTTKRNVSHVLDLSKNTPICGDKCILANDALDCIVVYGDCNTTT
jgi:hypothetical protein